MMAVDRSRRTFVGEPRVEVIKEVSSNKLFRETGRSYLQKRTGNLTKEVKIILPELSEEVTVSLLMNPSMNNVYESVMLFLAEWLPGHIKEKQEKEKNPDNGLTIREVCKDVYTENGRYRRRWEMLGNTADMSEIRSRQNIIDRIVKRYGRVTEEEFMKASFWEDVVSYLLKSGRVGRKKEGSDIPGKGLSRKTVSNMVGYLSICFDFAVSDALISFNPVQRFATPLLSGKAGHKSYSAFPEEIELRIMSEIAQYKDYITYAMYVILDLTGMRISEAMALTADSIDFEGHFIRIEKQIPKGKLKKTKTRTERYVPMGRLVEYALRPLVFGKKGSFLFGLSGKPYTRIKYSRALDRILAKFGFPKAKQEALGYVLHSFRHSFISHMVAKNISDQNISLITGHDTQRLSAMNARYTSQLKESFPQIIAAIDDIYDEKTTQQIISNLDLLCPSSWKK